MTLGFRNSYNAAPTSRFGTPNRGNQLTGHRTRSGVAPIAAALGLFTLLASPPLLGAASEVSSRGRAVRAVAQDVRGVTLEITPVEPRLEPFVVSGVEYTRVTIPGALIIEPPGAPALPALLVHVAVPDGMSPRLRVATDRWEERVAAPPVPVVRQRYVADAPETGPTSEYDFAPDPAIYGAGGVHPRDSVTLGPGSALGETWIAPIKIAPVRFDARAGVYRILRSMTLRVDFVPASDSERARRPRARPGGDPEPIRRMRDALVANAEAARMFPRRPELPPKPAPRVAAQNPEFKISVSTTGWTSVPFSTLSAVGFPSGVPIATIGVTERGYDDAGDSIAVTPVPVVARDGNSNGVFDGGDAITFFGRTLRERVGALSIENRYASRNVYWLTWTDVPAPVPGLIAGSVAAAAPQMPTSFPHTERIEQNHVLYATPSSFLGSPPENIEHVLWNAGDAPDDYTVDLSFLDADATQPFRVRARYQGQNGSTHRLNLFFIGSGGATDTLAMNQTFSNNNVFVLDTGFTVPTAHVGPGTNRYRHVGDRLVPGGSVFIPGSRAMLDWVEVTYPRRYIARSNRLQFTSGVADTAEIAVSGFTSATVEIYDVTDPVAPLRVLDVTVSPSGGGFEARFRTDASSGERRFVALVPGAEIPLPSGSVVADAASDLRDPEPFPSGSVARAIIITPEAFMAPATRLADHRRGQGFVVELAALQDVYDEFNGGIKSARAIRRYLRHAYAAWSPRPTFLVLAGDGTMDYRKDLTGSSADWVPTYLQFETIPGPQGQELVAHDSYYVLNLEHAVPFPEVDFTPSVFMGRIPASSAAELDAYVTKIVGYEAFKSTDTWRGRQLLVSDDEFSSTIFFTGGYCRQPEEAGFHAANVGMANTEESSAATQDIRSEFWDLKTYTDAVPTFIDGFGKTCRSLLDAKSKLAEPGGGYDQVAGQYSQGGLILNVQAHANRYLIGHETIFCGSTGSIIFCDQFVTPDRVQNVGRPWLLLVWGCHANQFPDGPSLGLAQQGGVDSTDSIGEIWTLLPNRGAIGSLGSTAYEFLGTNATYNQHVAESFYAMPPFKIPSPGEPAGARWLVGEVLGVAAIRNAQVPFFFQQVMNRTIMYLGDPMVRMDALPPRVFEVLVDGASRAAGDSVWVDGVADSLTLVARVRDEIALSRTELWERDVATGVAVPVDSAAYTVAVSDTSRQQELTARYRPHVGNYDLEVRAMDSNGRAQTFALTVRTPIRYYAGGAEIVQDVAVERRTVLAAIVQSPVPLTADSLELRLDGAPVTLARAAALDAVGRRWLLESVEVQHSEGSHTVAVAVGGRTGGLDKATYDVSPFGLRGVAVVSPHLVGRGCGGPILQYELTGPARRVEVLILSVAGRRVASFEAPTAIGLNVACWDGRDGQGRGVATGLYFFRLRAIDSVGETVSHTGRMIYGR